MLLGRPRGRAPAETRSVGLEPTATPASRRGEAGYLMVGMVAMVAILVIFSDLAFQAWADALRRENEAEMMFRAQDLVRAIQRYRRDHGGSPPMKLEDLMQPGPRNQYYLRQLWKDPLVRGGKWGLVYAGPGGELIDPNAAAPPTAPGTSGFGQPFASPSTGSAFADPRAAQGGQGSIGGIQPIGGATPGAAAPFGISGGGEDPNAGGKQLGGVPIAGVRTLATDKPFRVYNGLTEYSQWLFTYFDLERVQLPGGGRGGGAETPPPDPGAPFGKRPGAGRPGFGKRPGGSR